MLGDSPFFPGGRDKLIALSVRPCDPSIFQWREYVVAGGLVNYGMSLAADYRQMGVYVGRVLYGENGPRAGLAVSISVWVMSGVR